MLILPKGRLKAEGEQSEGLISLTPYCMLRLADKSSAFSSGLMIFSMLLSSKTREKIHQMPWKLTVPILHLLISTGS